MFVFFFPSTDSGNVKITKALSKLPWIQNQWGQMNEIWDARNSVHSWIWIWKGARLSHSASQPVLAPCRGLSGSIRSTRHSIRFEHAAGIWRVRSLGVSFSLSPQKALQFWSVKYKTCNVPEKEWPIWMDRKRQICTSQCTWEQRKSLPWQEGWEVFKTVTTGTFYPRTKLQDREQEICCPFPLERGFTSKSSSVSVGSSQLWEDYRSAANTLYQVGLQDHQDVAPWWLLGSPRELDQEIVKAHYQWSVFCVF